jgi:hypothetical protein
MDHVKISKEEIEALARKVSGLALEPHERDVLLAIFAAAADRAEPADPNDGKGKLPATVIKDQGPGIGGPEAGVGAGADEPVTPAELKRRLLNAYFPGTNDNPDTGTWQMKIARPPGGP